MTDALVQFLSAEIDAILGITGADYSEEPVVVYGKAKDRIEALTAERDEYKRNATHSEDVVRAARAEIERLRSLLAEADRRIVWEGHGLGGDFAERVEAALKGQQP